MISDASTRSGYPADLSCAAGSPASVAERPDTGNLGEGGFDKAEEFAEGKTDGKYNSKLQQGEQKAEDYLGVQDQDNNQQS
jgi:hypothetical protein